MRIKLSESEVEQVVEAAKLHGLESFVLSLQEGKDGWMFQGKTVKELVGRFMTVILPDGFQTGIEKMPMYLKCPLVVFLLEWLVSAKTDKCMGNLAEGFLSNAAKIIKDTYGWYNPKRYLSFLASSLFIDKIASLCRTSYMKRQVMEQGDTNKDEASVEKYEPATTPVEVKGQPKAQAKAKSANKAKDGEGETASTERKQAQKTKSEERKTAKAKPGVPRPKVKKDGRTKTEKAAEPAAQRQTPKPKPKAKPRDGKKS